MREADSVEQLIEAPNSFFTDESIPNSIVERSD